MSKVRDVTRKVEAVLRQYPDTRSDDRKLIQTVYGKYYGIDYYTPFGAVLKNNKLPPFETIRRARQKIQETNEDLRAVPKVEASRIAMQEEYLEYAREDVRI